MAAIHTEEQFEDEICEVLKAQGWLLDGPLPFQKGFAYDKDYDRRTALYPGACQGSCRLGHAANG